MNEQLQTLVQRAQRRPLGDSWTDATPREFADNLSKLIVVACADYVRGSEEITVGQGYMLRKQMLKNFGVEE